MRVICILQKDLLLLPLLHLYPVENEHTWNERKKKKIRRKLEIAIECGSKITSFYHIFWPGWQCTLLLQQVTYLKIANAIWNNFLHCHPKFQFPICQFCTHFLLHSSNSIKNAVCPWYSSFIGITFSYNIWRLVYLCICVLYNVLIKKCSNWYSMGLENTHVMPARLFSLHVHHDASSKWFEPMFVRQMDG